MDVKIKRIAMLLVWMLNPDIPELLTELRKVGYATAVARIRRDTYDLMPLEPPDVIAIKENVRIGYDFGRRVLRIECPQKEKFIQALEDIEKSLEYIGTDLENGVLFYELQIDGRVVGLSIKLPKIRLSEDLEILPLATDYIYGNPNTTRFLHIRFNPIWSCWRGEELTAYNLIIVYRNEKHKLISFLSNIEGVLSEFIAQVNKICREEREKEG